MSSARALGAALPQDDSVDASAPDFVVVDVETACARVSSICQIGIVGFRDGAEVFAYETLLDPCDDFSFFNTRIHGITAEHVLGMPSFGHVHSVVDGHLAGRITVAHSYFDNGALAAACRVHSREQIETTWLDSVRVAKRAWPHLPSHRLNVLSDYLGVRHRHHDALSDARAAGMVIVRAIEHTGIGLDGWLTPANPRGGKAPKAAEAGPLKGERITILGAKRDGPLAFWLADRGARVLTSIGTSMTMLVVSDDQPFGRFAHASEHFRRTEDLKRKGALIEIVTEAELKARVG